MNPMEDEVKEIKLWFPVANRYNSSGNIDYRFPQLTERITNSPSWTEFDEFVKNMIKTLIPQNQNLENIPTDEERRPDNIGGYTLFTPTSHVKRTKNGGSIKILT